MINIFFLLLAVLLVVAGAEIFFRKFLENEYDISFRNPSRILPAFYPLLNTIEKIKPSRDDNFFNILMLGSSVLEREWGEVEQCLSEQLALSGHKNIRIFNFSTAGLISLDSLYQYRAVESFGFDLVLFYPSGVEVKVDNVPPEFFKEDYSHFSNTEIKSYLIAQHETARFSLAYGLRAYAIHLRRQRNLNNYVPARIPRKKWVHFGAEMRSLVPFKRNVCQIMDIARQRGEKMIVMTQAFYIPEDYTLKSFQKKELDYVLHLLPCEMFGITENINRTFLAYNQTVRTLSEQYNIALVDQEALMKNSAECFNDIGHLTVKGSMRFVNNMMPQILSVLSRDNDMC